ncbi:putative FAD-linked oxidoreductase [Candidatus Kinetoplastibacterium sorsogonicusi]|uniref:Putative FAD-linked oxidoreductase n=1 Tax=Candidatus Kinetoplastidibacterium kentomonadis TaxID=1576550 RepID=A0A3Q8ER92_9PROT|nr:FAD-binding oxidoreductase [Candidatus Kinetoplastibacterium sorsogonicusi]AWD32236.1 putative FAD-linked oxidoreductase [Candidatus Kinetoplastibacterium sorsogonicusi]
MSIFKSLVTLLGNNRVIKGQDANLFLIDWRKRFFGNTIAVVFPKSTIEISEIVKLCIHYKISIVPQGGNTSLCGGSIPDSYGQSIVISTKFLNNIRNINLQDDVLIVEAGCILKNIQDYANKHNRFLPISLASEGTCTIGGNLSTNAGGTQVFRYGNVRELALGLEVVTAEGLILNNLKSLRKDNSGYSLKDLYIGSEGTLGIITAASLKLYHKPLIICTGLVYVNSIEDAINLLSYSKSKFGSNLITFEIMSKYSIELSINFINEKNIIINDQINWVILIEIHNYEEKVSTLNLLEKVLILGLEKNIIIDAIVAKNSEQQSLFWKIRESIPLAEAKLGKGIKHDISLPISSISEFLKFTNQQLISFFKDINFVIFGHLGDGNLHYNIFRSQNDISEDFFLSLQSEIYNIVHNNVYKFNGSICAEHGVGQLKVDEISKYKSFLEIELMKKIKIALDPHNIMNPGKVISLN